MRGMWDMGSKSDIADIVMRSGRCGCCCLWRKRLGLDPLWVTCDPENVASRQTLERVGARFVEEVDVPADCVIYQSGHPRKCRYRIDLGGEAA